MNKTVIIGASSNPNRYAFRAASDLNRHHHETILLSIHPGEISGKKFLLLSDKPQLESIDTVTMYINPIHQAEWMEYILSLSPRRIIFNPGTENTAFTKRASEQGIETIAACTLVMLATNQY